MSNWYCGRRALKRAANIKGVNQNAQVDRATEAASRRIDQTTRRFFIPKTETRLHSWPQRNGGRFVELLLDQGLISVDTNGLKTKAQDSSPTTISSSDFFLEPNNTGPPFNRIEIDLSSSAAFEAGDTSQRSISVLGSWGYQEDTRVGGTVRDSGGIDSSVTTLLVSDGGLVDVGDTLLIGSEQIFVSEVANAAEENADLVNGALVADLSEDVIVDTGSRFNAGEVILVNTEKMFVELVNGNTLAVIRAYDGTTLAAHSNNTAVHVFRTFTIERAVNGTSAASHSQTTAINVYAPPVDIVQLCIAEALAAYLQEGAGWGREVGSGDGATELSGRDLARLRKEVRASYMRTRIATV